MADKLWKPTSDAPQIGRRVVIRTNRESHPDSFWLEVVGDDFSKYAMGYTWCYLSELTNAYYIAERMLYAVHTARSVGAARRATKTLFSELPGEEK